MGHRFVKNNVVLNAVPAIDTTGAAQTGDYASMKGYRHLTVIINSGAVAATSAVTLKQATDVAATSEKALTFTEYSVKAGQVANFTDTTCSSTFDISTTANSLYVIEIDSSELDVDNAFDCVRVNLATPGAAAVLVSVVYVLSEPRYAEDAMPSAITD